MSELFSSDFLGRIQQLTIKTRLVLADGAAGNRKSRSKGSSVEFSDYREYTRGDDFRRIDWNAYGRFEKLFIKLFMEERESPVHIFLDTSKSMDWGEPNKSFASRRLAAALSYIALANYDRVSLLCLDNRISKSKLSLRGKNAFPEVLNFLEGVEYTGTTDLTGALKNYNMKSGKGISIVISDLLYSEGLPEIIKYLQYRKQEVHIFHILSLQELKPELESSLRLIDMETREFKDITVSPLLLKTYNKILGQFLSGIEECCFKYGANYMKADSSMPIEQMIRMVVGEK